KVTAPVAVLGLTVAVRVTFWPDDGAAGEANSMVVELALVVLHAPMDKRLTGDPPARNRPTGNVLEAVPPAAAENTGAQERLTLAVPSEGLEEAPALYICQTPKRRISIADGLLLITSQTAVAVPFVTVSSASPVDPGDPFTEVVAFVTGTMPLVSAADSLCTS